MLFRSTISPSSAPTVTIALSGNNPVCATAPAVFTATPSAGVVNPAYTWQRNGVNVAGGATFTTTTLANNDVVTLTMTAGSLCGASTTVNSNAITVGVTPSVVPGININTIPPSILCAGTPVNFVTNITAGGTAPAYQWYKNNTPVAGATSPTYLDASLMQGDTITVRLTSNATCAVPAIVMSNKLGLTVNPVVTPAINIFTSPGSVILPGITVTFTANYSGGGSTPTFQWYKNGAPLSGATTPVYTTSNLASGDAITVTMVSYAPCPVQPRVTSAPVVITRPASAGVGTSANAANWQVALYPNPNNGHFTIDVNWGNAHRNERVHLEVINAIGQQIWNTELQPAAATWSQPVWLRDDVANGTYLLRMSTADGSRYAMPFTINR